MLGLRFLLISIAILHFFFQVVYLSLIHLTLVLLLDHLILLILQETLDLFVQNANFLDVLLVQGAHLLEHFGLYLRAFLIVFLIAKTKQILQLFNFGLLLLYLRLELKQ